MQATGGTYKRGDKRDGQLNIARPNFWNINISNYLRQKVTLQLKKLTGSNT